MEEFRTSCLNCGSWIDARNNGLCDRICESEYLTGQKVSTTDKELPTMETRNDNLPSWNEYVFGNGRNYPDPNVVTRQLIEKKEAQRQAKLKLYGFTEPTESPEQPKTFRRSKKLR